jgi:hypothetical protein
LYNSSKVVALEALGVAVRTSMSVILVGMTPGERGMVVVRGGGGAGQGPRRVPGGEEAGAGTGNQGGVGAGIERGAEAEIRRGVRDPGAGAERGGGRRGKEEKELDLMEEMGSKLRKNLLTVDTMSSMGITTTRELMSSRRRKRVRLGVTTTMTLLSRGR